jgi:hypothetical protein
MRKEPDMLDRTRRQSEDYQVGVVWQVFRLV